MASNAYRTWLIDQLPPATLTKIVNGVYVPRGELPVNLQRFDYRSPDLDNIKILEETEK